MQNFLRISLLLLAISLSNCTSLPKTEGPKSVSIEQIKEKLRLDRDIQDLGYSEKPFNACEMGLRNDNCVNEFLVIIHFQLMCRESEGTVNEAPDLIPVKSDAISWILGDATGTTQTDDQGYGRLETVRLKSSSGSRLRLTIDKRFVAVPASETTRLVVPQDWCPKSS